LSEAERVEEAKLKPITHLKEAVDLLLPQDRNLFFRLYELVDDRFMSDGSPRPNGHMKIPLEMREKVFRLFKDMVGSDDSDEVCKAVENQWTVFVTDRYSKRKAIFNPFRGSRPIDKNIRNFFLEDIEDQKKKSDCDFCHAETSTPEGEFGRFKDDVGISFTNLTKFAPYHEIFAGPHNPYEMTEEDFISQMKKALAYGHTVYNKDPEAIHLAWGMNFGYKAGASKVHQHSQVIVCRGMMHQSEAEEFHEAAKLYRKEYPNSDYLSDWLRVHEVLGLARHFDDPESHDGIWAVMSLTPSKERHAIVIGSRNSGYDVSEKFARYCWHLVNFMMKDSNEGGEGVMEFNTKLFMTPFGRGEEYWSDFPPMFTIIDRGVSTAITSDFGFMETSGTVVLSTDPKIIAPKLFRSLAQAA